MPNPINPRPQGRGFFFGAEWRRVEKMGVRNSAGMVVYAIKKGWVDLDRIDP